MIEYTPWDKNMERKHLQTLQKKLRGLGDLQRATLCLRFFKTGKGEYGEGDQFLGIPMPMLRKVARQYQHLSLNETKRLLASPFHEARMAALLILCLQYVRGDETARKRIYHLYLANTKRINNWDLVDVTAPHIVGAHLLSRSRGPLYRLAKSPFLWDRRIAMVSTVAFIREKQFHDTLAIADVLLHDPHDLIHKAVGWMLREVGNRSQKTLKDFLDARATRMPRVMLRYALEKLSAKDKRRFMKVCYTGLI